MTAILLVLVSVVALALAGVSLLLLAVSGPAKRRGETRRAGAVRWVRRQRRRNPFRSQGRMLLLIVCGPLTAASMLVLSALGPNAQLNLGATAPARSDQYTPDGVLIQTRTDSSADRTRGYCNQLRWPNADAELEATTAAAWATYGAAMCAAYPPPAGAVR